MRSGFLAPFAKLLELNFALNRFLIFARPVIYALTRGALQFNQIVLAHINIILRIKTLKINLYAFSLYQAVDRNRTDDLLLTMEMLCRLSYNGISFLNKSLVSPYAQGGIRTPVGRKAAWFTAKCD